MSGTIYPGGTIPPGMANNDPNAPGGIGKITCRGTYLIGSTDAASGAPIVANVTELYMFNDDFNELIADGRTPNMGVSIERTVVGGTGHYRFATGEVHEENIGLNGTGFCNLRVTFTLRRAMGPPISQK